MTTNFAFDESKVRRDDDGKFAPKVGGGRSPEQTHLLSIVSKLDKMDRETVRRGAEQAALEWSAMPAPDRLEALEASTLVGEVSLTEEDVGEIAWEDLPDSARAVMVHAALMEMAQAEGDDLDQIERETRIEGDVTPVVEELLPEGPVDPVVPVPEIDVSPARDYWIAASPAQRAAVAGEEFAEVDEFEELPVEVQQELGRAMGEVREPATRVEPHVPAANRATDPAYRYEVPSTVGELTSDDWREARRVWDSTPLEQRVRSIMMYWTGATDQDDLLAFDDLLEDATTLAGLGFDALPEPLQHARTVAAALRRVRGT